MPWTCTGCQTESADDVSECPTCSQAKTSWTVVGDVTRSFVVVGGKRFELRRGEQTAPGGPGADAPLVPISKISAIDKAEVRGWFDADHQPPSAYLVFVALYPRGAPNPTVTLELMFASRPSEELELPAEPPPDAAPDDPVHVPILFVRGAGDLTGVEFPGTHLVDVSEDTEEGFAPTVEFRALGKPAQELPVIGTKRRHLVWSL